MQQDEFVAAATFQQLLMQTSTDEWQESLQVKTPLVGRVVVTCESCC